jgi:hypothetical protein
MLNSGGTSGRLAERRIPVPSVVHAQSTLHSLRP